MFCRDVSVSGKSIFEHISTFFTSGCPFKPLTSSTCLKTCPAVVWIWNQMWSTWCHNNACVILSAYTVYQTVLCACVFVCPASVLQAMAVLVCAEMYQVKRLQHLCEVCVCAYLQSMPSRELSSTGISVIRLLRRAKVSATFGAYGGKKNKQTCRRQLDCVNRLLLHYDDVSFSHQNAILSIEEI